MSPLDTVTQPLNIYHPSEATKHRLINIKFGQTDYTWLIYTSGITIRFM